MKTLLLSVFLMVTTFCITYFSLITKVVEYNNLRQYLKQNSVLERKVDSLQNVCDSLQANLGYLEVQLNKLEKR